MVWGPRQILADTTDSAFRTLGLLQAQVWASFFTICFFLAQVKSDLISFSFFNISFCMIITLIRVKTP
jgi:hypothetical protein